MDQIGYQPYNWPPLNKQDEYQNPQEWSYHSGQGQSNSYSDYNPNPVPSRPPFYIPQAYPPIRLNHSRRVSPEEAERRRVRRERNKVAAAKCRQRRVDHTNKLINETDKLEDDKASLESEIQSLQQQKDQLEFILQAHNPVCKADGLINKLRVKSEYRSQCNGDTNRSSGLPSLQTIKREMPDYVDDYTSQCSMKTDHHALHASSRPSSLPLQAKTSMSRSSLSSATGISITTPTSGFFTGYSSLDMENHSGLTPLGGPSCASQIQKTSDSSPDGVTSPTLISL